MNPKSDRERPQLVNHAADVVSQTKTAERGKGGISF